MTVADAADDITVPSIPVQGVEPNPNVAVLALMRIGAAIDRLRIGIASFSPSRQLLVFNTQFIELFELPADRIVGGMDFSEVLDLTRSASRTDGSDARFIAEQYAADRHLRGESRRRLDDGRVIDILSDPTPGGGWIITINDISALAKAEDELRQRAELLHSILDNIPHGVCVYGPDRRVTMFNHAYHLVMREAPLTVGDHLEDIIRRRAEAGEYGPGDTETLIAEVLAHDTTKPQSRRRVRPNGISVDVRTAPLPDGGHISVVTDITALVEAENQANRRADNMNVMLNSMRHGILLWNSDGRLVAGNDLAAEMLGHAPGALVPGILRNQLIEDGLARGVYGLGEDAMTRADVVRRRDHSVSNRRFVETPDGRMLEAVSDPIAGGGVVSTFTDVTLAHETERELRRAKMLAEAANQAKSRFLATMSHELRTPLNTVIGFSDAIMREAGAATPAVALDVAEFAGSIHAAGQQLLRQVNAILDVARLESGRFELQSEPVDLAALFDTCLRQNRMSAEAAEIRLDGASSAPVPAFLGDPQRMAQVLGHLVGNALKFTEPGGRVTLSAEVEHSGSLSIRVTDTGIGIPQADLQRVFEPFVQLDASLARRFQGAGLGLYISRALVEAQGGTLVLTSHLGAGTVAEITIPRTRKLPPNIAAI